MNQEEKPTIYTSVCNKSNMMSDYNIRFDNSKLYLTNKITKVEDFIILDVAKDEIVRTLFYVKHLLLSINKSSKYYILKDLKVRFKDLKMQKKFKYVRTRKAKRPMTLSLISVILKRKLIQSKQMFVRLAKKLVARLINFKSRHSEHLLPSSKQNIKNSHTKLKNDNSLKCINVELNPITQIVNII